MTKLLIFRVSMAFSAVLGVALAFVPLLAVHGVESALALGLMLPPFVAATGARYAQRHASERGIDLMLRAVGAGLAIWAVPVIILALSAIRVRQCAPGEGLAFMVLGPGVGSALAAVVGVWVAGTAKRGGLAPWIAGGIPLGSALLGLLAFYATPTVYVFGAFAGYFPGAIYDDLVRIPTRYLTYRASMVLTVLALAVLFDALWSSEAGRIDLKGRAPARLGMILVSFGALGVVGASYWYGDQLGHWVSDAYVVERLGKTERGRHCLAHMPRETDPEDARRLIEDCDFHVERLRALTGLHADEPVTAYFFRSQDEKKNLIGVGRTLISKPWRREVYLQMSRWPHPVLGHEIVHAVLSEAGRGPFAVASRFGGLLPNPGMIEGAAVALAWDVRDDLDPDQWSRIMKDRQELPSARTLMSVQFSSLPARHAYMAAGSLVRFLIATRGIDAFLEDHRHGEVRALDALEAEWREYLDTVAVTLHERGVAEVALSRPSIFSAVCPHALAQLRADLAGDMAARDDERTLETCREILDIDNTEMQARAMLIGALARSGKQERAEAELEALEADPSVPAPIVATALEEYADATWTLGNHDEAAALYDALLVMPQTDGPARQREVKRLALGANPAQRDIIYQLLVDRASSPVAVHLAQSLAAIRQDGLGRYLEARQLLGQSRFSLALPLLQEAKRLGLPTLRLERELSRLLGMSYFAVGQYGAAAQAWKERGWVSLGAAAEAERWLERIEYTQTGQVSPKLGGPSSAHRAAP